MDKRFKELVEEPYEKVEKCFERLLEYQKEYQEKLEFAKDLGDKEKIIRYEGACEGLKVATLAFNEFCINNFKASFRGCFFI
ncbi:hypothetical protein [Peribacillus butanolivorans]|uniref:hypothetical protein n=1 Tax=Peribacillus butanolivorans TaxID=421767 RepID=UPI0036D9749C